MDLSIVTDTQSAYARSFINSFRKGEAWTPEALNADLKREGLPQIDFKRSQYQQIDASGASTPTKFEGPWIPAELVRALIVLHGSYLEGRPFPEYEKKIVREAAGDDIDFSALFPSLIDIDKRTLVTAATREDADKHEAPRASVDIPGVRIRWNNHDREPMPVRIIGSLVLAGISYPASVEFWGCDFVADLAAKPLGRSANSPLKLPIDRPELRGLDASEARLASIHLMQCDLENINLFGARISSQVVISGSRAVNLNLSNCNVANGVRILRSGISFVNAQELTVGDEFEIRAGLHKFVLLNYSAVGGALKIGYHRADCEAQKCGINELDFAHTRCAVLRIDQYTGSTFDTDVGAPLKGQEVAEHKWLLPPGKVNLEGLTYDAVVTDNQVSVAWIKSLLERQGGSSDISHSFRPQPWEQAARVLRSFGYISIARYISMEKERLLYASGRPDGLPLKLPALVIFALLGVAGALTAAIQPSWSTWALLAALAGLVAAVGGLRQTTRWSIGWIARWLTGQGYAPWRLGVASVILVAFATIVFDRAYHQGYLAPEQPHAALAELVIQGELRLERDVSGWRYVTIDGGESVDIARPRADVPEAVCTAEHFERFVDRFNPFVYALDTFVPIIELGQEASWSPTSTKFTCGDIAFSTGRDKPFWAAGAAVLDGSFFSIFNWMIILSGWFVTSLLAVSITGLMKTGRD